MRLVLITIVFFFITAHTAFAGCTKADICEMIGDAKLNHFAILDLCPDAGQMMADCRKVSEKKLEILPPAAFVDNGDGTVTDTVNKLLWIKKGIRKKKVNLKDAKAIASSSQAAKKSGWRLPTLSELRTLVYKERIINVSGKKAWINPIFDDGRGNYYWSTTSCTEISAIEDRFQRKICQAGEGATWLVNFNVNAVLWFHTKLERPYVWLVQNIK